MLLIYVRDPSFLLAERKRPKCEQAINVNGCIRKIFWTAMLYQINLEIRLL